jgi:thiamine pyrophosphate-dependent acetolactate synthase large subunit-like protein
MARETGADVLARILKAEGVEQVICFPLSSIMEALTAHDIRVITTRQERVAGNMADGVSRSTNGRRIGVVAVQALAGAENAFAGVAHSYTDSTPILFLPGHPGVDLIGQSPTFDSLANYAATTKHATRVLSADLMAPRLRQAFAALRSGRPQPVMLELPDDVLEAEADDPAGYRPVPWIRPGPDDGAVREAADRLLRAERPLIWSGHGVLYAEASRELTEVAELLGAPVMTTLMGKSGFDETHELSAGVAGYSESPVMRHFLDTSDVLLAVGSSLSTTSFTPTVPDGKVLLHVTNDPRDLFKTYPTDVAIHSDAKLFLTALADELRGRVGGREQERRRETAATIASLRAAWLADFEPLFAAEGTPIPGYRMFRELWSVLDPDETILTHESGHSRDIQSLFYRARTPRSYIAWGHSTQLGFSLGLAMGAKLANPDKLVVNVMGDAAVGMTGMDWETASREGIPILTVIKHDSIFSMYDQYIPESIAKHHSSSQYGDYAGVARSLGCHAERVSELAELRPALQRGIEAVTGGQPAVVDVITAETRRLSQQVPGGSH